MRDVVDKSDFRLLGSGERFRNPRRGAPARPRRLGEGAHAPRSRECHSVTACPGILATRPGSIGQRGYPPPRRSGATGPRCAPCRSVHHAVRGRRQKARSRRGRPVASPGGSTPALEERAGSPLTLARAPPRWNEMPARSHSSSHVCPVRPVELGPQCTFRTHVPFFRPDCGILHPFHTNEERAREEGSADGLPTPRRPVGARNFVACHPHRCPGGRRAAALQPPHHYSPPDARSGVDPDSAGQRRGALPGTTAAPRLAAPAGDLLARHRRALDGYSAAHGRPRRSRGPGSPGRARRRRPRRGSRRVPPRAPALAAPAGPGPSPAPVGGGKPRVRPPLRPEHSPPRPEPLGELLPRWHHLPERPAPAAPAGPRGLYPGARALPHPGAQSLPSVLAPGCPTLSHVPGPSRGTADGREAVACVGPRSGGARRGESARIRRKLGPLLLESEY